MKFTPICNRCLNLRKSSENGACEFVDLSPSLFAREVLQGHAYDEATCSPLARNLCSSDKSLPETIIQFKRRKTNKWCLTRESIMRRRCWIIDRSQRGVYIQSLCIQSEIKTRCVSSWRRSDTYRNFCRPGIDWVRSRSENNENPSLLCCWPFKRLGWTSELKICNDLSNVIVNIFVIFEKRQWFVDKPDRVIIDAHVLLALIFSERCDRDYFIL